MEKRTCLKKVALDVFKRLGLDATRRDARQAEQADDGLHVRAAREEVLDGRDLAGHVIRVEQVCTQIQIPINARRSREANKARSALCWISSAFLNVSDRVNGSSISDSPVSANAVHQQREARRIERTHEVAAPASRSPGFPACPRNRGAARASAPCVAPAPTHHQRQHNNKHSMRN